MSSIEVIDLVKSFGPLTAADRVSFRVEDGLVLATLAFVMMVLAVWAFDAQE